MYALLTIYCLKHDRSWGLLKAVADVGWSESETVRQEGQTGTDRGPPCRQRMGVCEAEDTLLLKQLLETVNSTIMGGVL